jgi:cell wall-associated NlpC family hydrolase
MKPKPGMKGLLAFAIGLTHKYKPGAFGYVWGAQGQIITEEELRRLEKTYGPNGSGSPNYYHQDRTRKWIGKRAADCSGLIMYIFELMGIYTQDMTADTLYRKSAQKPEWGAEPGDLMFKMKDGRAVHVGIRIQGNKTVHSRGTDHGLVTTTDNEYSWDRAGTYPGIPNMKPVEVIELLKKT